MVPGRKKTTSQLAVLLLGCLPLSSCITNPGNVKKNRVTRWSNHPKKRYSQNPAIISYNWSVFFSWVWRFPPKNLRIREGKASHHFRFFVQDPILTFIICDYFNRKKNKHLQGRLTWNLKMMVWKMIFLFIQILDSSPTSESVWAQNV